MVALYKYVVPKPKSECSKTEQLGVSFAAGYIAGVFCAVVSQPADNLVSKLNSVKVRYRSGRQGRAEPAVLSGVAIASAPDKMLRTAGAALAALLTAYSLHCQSC